MTNQAIPADKVREWVTSWETTRPEHRTLEDAEGIIQALRDLLPTPPRPTLADMTEEERKACQWMQADVEGRFDRWVITRPFGGGGVEAVSESGQISWFPPRRVTPRPGLPRLEWPGDKKPAPAPTLPDGWRLADQRKYGRVIVTNPTPDRDGYVYFVVSTTGPIGNTWHFCRASELTYLDQEAGQ